MLNYIDQRICIQFCIANEISCTLTFKMLQKAYGDQCLSRTRTFEWYKMFKEGREVVEDESRSGRPSTSTDEHHADKVKEIMVMNNLRGRRVTVKEIADDVGISLSSAHRILKKRRKSSNQSSYSSS